MASAATCRRPECGLPRYHPADRSIFTNFADHVLAAKRLQDDDTPAPVLTKGKTDRGQAWVYARGKGREAGGRRVLPRRLRGTALATPLNSGGHQATKTQKSRN